MIALKSMNPAEVVREEAESASPDLLGRAWTPHHFPQTRYRADPPMGRKSARRPGRDEPPSGTAMSELVARPAGRSGRSGWLDVLAWDVD
jgi:hypothetical protein